MSTTFHNLIGDRWVPARSGATFTSVNPANHDDVIGEFPASGPEDVDDAVQAAAKAFPAWSLMPAPKRGEILFKIARLLAEHKEELARLMTREMGKVLTEARGDVQEAIDVAYYMAGEGRRLFGQTVPSEMPDKFAMAIRRPIGVVGIITPWNFPIAIPAWKLFPALICGNTAVIKPASDTPACLVRFVELLQEGGLPPGVVNLVTGSGGSVGNAIVDHPDVRAISFTGHTETGVEISRRAAETLKRVSLELGGKNPIVIWEDADLDLALDSVVWSAFGTSGQRCTAASRIIVHRSIHDTVAEKLRDRVARLVLGDGLLETTDVGPVINDRAVERIAQYAAVGRNEGELLIGGEPAREGDLARGSFFQPTIFAEVRPDARIAQEEIFGPLTALVPVDTWEETVEVVNSVKYGLSTSLFTRDINLAFRSIRDFDSGLGYVNHGTIGAEAHLPFGGTKATGNGHREVGQAALDFFSEWKSVYIDYSGRLQRAQIDTEFLDQG
ncbi:MAG TPA: aldehyde dehydrogenase family protein [candidate division Zixibacteria bacterium]|nr:aldehyde dehydrogenase family protein [candidate division Zixibacteria bacterium]